MYLSGGSGLKHLSLAEENAKLRAENQRLREEREAIQADQRVMTCAFCGQAYPPGTPPSNHAALRSHILVCPDHPMRKFVVALLKATEFIDQALNYYPSLALLEGAPELMQLLIEAQEQLPQDH